MNIAHLLIHTLNVAAPMGVNTAGELTYGTAAAVKARVEQTQNIVKNADGQMIVADHEFLTTTAIGTQDRVWLPGDSTGDATLARTPQVVEQVAGLDGADTLYRVLL